MFKELFVHKIKNEFIKAIMASLKIEENPFITSTIDSFIENIKPTDYKNFMKVLFGADHSYLNAMDRIAKVAAIFDTSKKIVKSTMDDTEALTWINVLRKRNVPDTEIKTQLLEVGYVWRF